MIQIRKDNVEKVCMKRQFEKTIKKKNMILSSPSDNDIVLSSPSIPVLSFPSVL